MTILNSCSQAFIAIGLLCFVIARANKEDGYEGFTINSIACFSLAIICTFLEIILFT